MDFVTSEPIPIMANRPIERSLPIVQPAPMVAPSCTSVGSVSSSGSEDLSSRKSGVVARGNRSFVKIVPAAKGQGPHTKWATGSNLIFLSYAVNPDAGLVVTVAAIDNLGKGAAGQAMQNANLMTGQPETAGLAGLPLWP